MDANEVVWNLKRLIRDGHPQGLALSSLESEYWKYFSCYQFPSPNPIQPGCKDWAAVFTKSPKFQEWFKLDGRKRIRVLPKPERDLKVYFRLVSYIQYIAQRQGAKVDNLSGISESESEKETDSFLAQALESGLRQPINLHESASESNCNEQLHEVESVTSSPASNCSKRPKADDNDNNCLNTDAGILAPPDINFPGPTLTSSQEIHMDQIQLVSSAAAVEKRSVAFTFSGSCPMTQVSVSHMSGSEFQPVHSTANTLSHNLTADENEPRPPNCPPLAVIPFAESRPDHIHTQEPTQVSSVPPSPLRDTPARTLALLGVKTKLGQLFQPRCCNLCNADIKGVRARLAHYKGNLHRNQLQKWLHGKKLLRVQDSENLTWEAVKRRDNEYETWESRWLVVLNNAARVLNLPEVVERLGPSKAEENFRLKLPQVRQSLEHAYYTFSELLWDLLELQRNLKKMYLQEEMPGYAEIRQLEDMFTREAASHIQEYKSTFVT